MELIFMILLIILGPILALLYYDLKGIYQIKMENAAKANTCWELLEKINAQYSFKQLYNQSLDIENGNTIIFHKNTNSKGFNQKKFLLSEIYKNLEAFEKVLQCSANNTAKYKEYYTRITQLFNSNFPSPNFYESKLFEEKQLHPMVEPKIIIKGTKSIYYGFGSTGYEHYKVEYDYDKWLPLVEEAKAERGRKTFIQRQRDLMSDRLRLNVFMRDKFRCVYCGSSRSDGVTLEVDHIIPVSKGGKTEINNLQTLCERCNRGKSNQTSPLLDNQLSIKKSYDDIFSKSFTPNKPSLKQITVNTKITIEIKKTHEREQYIITNDNSKLSDDKISFKSPLGQALMHHHIGEIVTVHSPNGDYEVEILEIQNLISH